jgi:hypothetical protein
VRKPRVHHLILDVGVHRQQLDDLPNDLGLLLDRLLTGGPKFSEQAADFLVIGLQYHDGIR